MIISASRRTDIPAFHSEWFMNRIREGYAIVSHHYSSELFYRVPLTPDVVDCIMFRTKDPAPMLPRLGKLADYRCCFNVTMNPYGREVERNVPRLQDRVEVFKKLSHQLGPQQMIWRYDPVFFSPKYDLDFHRRAFGYLCRELDGLAEKCMIGFIIHHPFVAKRIDPLSIERRDDNEIQTIGALFSEIAKPYGLQVETCSERVGLDMFGIRHGACVERGHMEKVAGYFFPKVKEKYLRPHCNCMEAIDIGHYSTCDNGCIYCYATPETPDMDIDPHSPSLDPAFRMDKVAPGRIVEMSCRSFRDTQPTLF